MKKLRTGIIGCGKVGSFHAQAYARLPGSEFAAVCDADRGRAEAFASQWGVRAYTDVEQMCREAHLDIVSVCTPHPLHANPAVGGGPRGGARAGVKAQGDPPWPPPWPTAMPSLRRVSVTASPSAPWCSAGSTVLVCASTRPLRTESWANPCWAW